MIDSRKFVFLDQIPLLASWGGAMINQMSEPLTLAEWIATIPNAEDFADTMMEAKRIRMTCTCKFYDAAQKINRAGLEHNRNCLAGKGAK